MKNFIAVTLACFFFASNIYALTGVFQTYTFINQNGGGPTVYEGTIQNPNNARFTNFVGLNFTNPNTLLLTGAEAHIFKSGGGDVTGGTFFYRVYEQSSAAPGYSSFAIVHKENCGATAFPSGGQCGGTDQKWATENLTIDLLNGITTNGTYNIDVYWVMNTNEGDRTDGSAGSPRTATITINNLPIELVSLNVKTVNKLAKISWITASELNNSHFDIEKSTNTRTWQKIGTIQGHGTTQQEQHYSFIDKNPFKGINYYRLKQVDFDGRSEYSKTVSVDFSNNNGVSIYPNPVGDRLYLKSENKEDELIWVNIYNIHGQFVKTEFGISGKPIDVNALRPGMYLIEIKNNNGRNILIDRFFKK